MPTYECLCGDIHQYEVKDWANSSADDKLTDYPRFVHKQHIEMFEE